jgi:hypothetical protein
VALFATTKTTVFLSESVSLFGRIGRLRFIAFIRGISARGSLKAGFGNLVCHRRCPAVWLKPPLGTKAAAGGDGSDLSAVISRRSVGASLVRESILPRKALSSCQTNRAVANFVEHVWVFLPLVEDAVHLRGSVPLDLVVVGCLLASR